MTQLKKFSRAYVANEPREVMAAKKSIPEGKPDFPEDLDNVSRLISTEIKGIDSSSSGRATLETLFRTQPYI